MKSQRPLGAGVLAALALLFLLPTGWRALWTPDEGRYADIPRQMLRSGDWVTPRIDGVKFLDKPPLAYWCEAAAMRLFGTSERAVRAVPALFGLFGIVVVFVAGRWLWGTRAGILGATILGTSPLYFAVSDLVSLDIVVSVLIAATLLAFLAALESAGRRRDLLLLAFYAAAALAVLAKGLIGIVIPGLVIVPWLLATGRWREIPRLRLVPGLLLFLLIALPWHLLMQQRNPEWAWYYFVHEHFLRYTTRSHQRSQPLWFFLPVLALGFFPWIALLPGALRRFWSERTAAATPGAPPRVREARLFFVLWATLVIAFFSASSSKLIPYIVPALPPMALLLGEEWARRGGLGRKAAWGVAGACGVFVAAIAVLPRFAAPGSSALAAYETLGPLRFAMMGALLVLAATAVLARRRPLALAGASALVLLALAGSAARFDDDYSVKSIAETLRPRLAADDLVVAFDGYPRDLPFYLDRRVAIANWLGDDFDYGTNWEDTSQWLFELDDFARLWNGPRRMYAVLEARSLRKLQRVTKQPPRIVARGRRYVVAVNRAAPVS